MKSKITKILFLFAFIFLISYHQEVEASPSGKTPTRYDMKSPNVYANRIERPWNAQRVNSSLDTWQGWIDWYASLGYSYSGYYQAEQAAGFSGGQYVPVGDTVWWTKFYKDGREYWSPIIQGNGATLYGSMKYSWIITIDATGTSYAYYIDENYLILQDQWVCCRVSTDQARNGWFYLDRNGRMLTGWNKDVYNRWYYFKIDTTYHSDGEAIPVAYNPDGSGLLWAEVENYNNGRLYNYTGIQVNTAVRYINALGDEKTANYKESKFITPLVHNQSYSYKRNTCCYTSSATAVKTQINLPYTVNTEIAVAPTRKNYFFQG